MKATLIGVSGSSLMKLRRAWVGCPFTSLTPKISDCGKEAETFTARDGDWPEAPCLRLTSSSVTCCKRKKRFVSLFSSVGEGMFSWKKR